MKRYNYTNILLKRYNYTDVTLYKRSKGLYLNITDFEVSGDNQKIPVKGEKSKYIIVLNPVESKITTLYYVSASLTDIQVIIGIADKKYKDKLSLMLQNSEYADLVYAETIVNTGRNKRILIENGTVHFQQRTMCNGKKEWHTYIEFELKQKNLEFELKQKNKE